MKTSITLKLALTSVASVFAVMAVFGAFSYVSEKSRLQSALDNKAAHLQARLQSGLKLPLYQFDSSQISAVLDLEMKDGDVFSIVVMDDHDTHYQSRLRAADGSIRTRASDDAREEPPGGCYAKLSGEIRHDAVDRVITVGRVVSCVTDTSLKRSLNTLIVNQLMQTVVLSLALCLCIFFSLRLVLVRPILAMREAVGKFARMDFSSRAEFRVNDEMGELGRHFNQMAATIQSHSNNLERLIEERTRELVQKNEIIVLEKELADAATQAKTELLAKQQELIEKLEDTQGKLLQSEKMASVGQLAAGVAHEINNPIGFIHSNLGSLKKQVDNLLAVIAVFEKAETALLGHLDLLESIRQAKSAADFEFLREDIQSLIQESLDGVQRVKKIVDNLKEFSRVDSAEWQFTNLEKALESTLAVVWNEIKSKVEICREFAGVPEIECVGSQINQVFMGLLMNAVYAISISGQITLRTGFDEKEVWIEVEDDGCGIAPEHLGRLFEPFFTTRPVGQGTGLGLSLAYSIVHRHQGRIDVRSELGGGSVFRVTLPRVRASEPDGT